MKRIFDFLFSLLGLVVLSPFMMLIACRIKSEDGGPIFYRGIRVGLNHKEFRIYKFRTMVMHAEDLGGSSTANDDPRITKIGKILRKYKFDELPQLINVLTGDMSLVGPRPQVKWAVNLYTPEESKILAVRPGITDYASLKFAKEGEILKGSKNPDRDYMEKIHPQKMKLSLYYVDNHTLVGDIKIILKTIFSITGGRN